MAFKTKEQRAAYQKQYYKDNKKKINKQNYEWSQKNPVAAKAIWDRWKRNNPERRKEVARNHYWRTKKITNKDGSYFTMDDYKKLWAAQGGCCAVCKKPASHFSKSLAADHNHKTGFIRGLLCFYCNKRVVGRFTYATALRLFEYLKATEGVNNG